MPGREEFGELRVECLPWADVIVDSVKLETTPMARNLRLWPGSHELRLVNPGYPVYRKLIDISPMQLAIVKVNLDTLFGYLQCEVYPWAEILVNGKSHGQTPLHPIQLLPGEYTVTAMNAQGGLFERKITVTQNDTVRLKYKFEGF
jgi:hypothetical protein